MENSEYINELPNSERLKWTPDATLHLITLVKKNSAELQNGVKKVVYTEIANELNLIHDLNLTFDQVDSKWKGLKKTYEKLKKRNKKGRQARLIWEYYDEIDDILQEAANNPPAVLSTEDKSVLTREYQEDLMDEEPETFVMNFRKRRRRNTDKDKDRDREAAIERRHAEKMQAVRRFLDLFKKMVDKM